MKEEGRARGYRERLAADGPRWRSLVAALCALPFEEDSLTKTSQLMLEELVS